MQNHRSDKGSSTWIVSTMGSDQKLVTSDAQTLRSCQASASTQVQTRLLASPRTVLEDVGRVVCTMCQGALYELGLATGWVGLDGIMASSKQQTAKQRAVA